MDGAGTSPRRAKRRVLKPTNSTAARSSEQGPTPDRIHMSRRVGVRRTCDALKTQHRCPKASLPEGIAAEKSTWQKFQRPRSSLHCAQRPSNSYNSHGQGEFKKKILIQTHLISHSSSIHSPHIIHSPRSQTPIDGPWRGNFAQTWEKCAICGDAAVPAAHRQLRLIISYPQAWPSPATGPRPRPPGCQPTGPSIHLTARR